MTHPDVVENRATEGTTDRDARTRAFLGLSLSLVGLVGGGVFTNAVYALYMGSPISEAMISVAQFLPSGLTGLVGGALGLSATRSTDDLAVPVARCAAVLGLVTVGVAVGLAVIWQISPRA